MGRQPVRSAPGGGLRTCDPHPELSFRFRPSGLARRVASLSQTDRQHVEEFSNLLEESVRLRLIAEVSLGVFLSGGLDSSSMLALMSKTTGGERVKTFSVGYDMRGPAEAEARESNELSYAREAAARFGAEHHEFSLTARDFMNITVGALRRRRRREYGRLWPLSQDSRPRKGA